MADNKPLQPIIKKIKKGGHGHHGGAWKVAYADFVTAMMAFFLLLWLLNATPSEKLKGVAEYFTPTIGVRDKMGMGFEAGNNPQVDGKDKSRKANDNIIFGAPSSGAVVKLPDSVRTKDEIDAKNFTSMQNDLYKAIHKNPELREFTENILIDQTPEGLRIQITDAKDRPMFIPGTSTLQPYMKKILTVIAKYIRYLPNYISVGGHTSLDKSASKPGSYDQWQLSAERANSARRFLTDGNIDPEQIARIIGKGDTDPLDIKDPYSYKNIRLSLVILKNSILPYSKQSATESDLDINNESSASKEPSTSNE